MANGANEWTILLRPRARKDIRRLSREMRGRIQTAMEELSHGPRQASNVKQLKLSEPIYRKRVGDYRIVFEINDQEKQVLVHAVPHRSDAY